LTKKGQATIPKEMREKHNVGQRVLAGILLKPLPKPSQERGSLKSVLGKKTAREILTDVSSSVTGILWICGRHTESLLYPLNLSLLGPHVICTDWGVRCPACNVGHPMLIEEYSGPVRRLQYGNQFRPIGIAACARLPLPQKLKAWIQLVRPFTLLAPALAVLFGTIACLAAQRNLVIFWPNFAAVFSGMVALAAAQAVGQILNQSEEDPGVDIMNKKGYRPIPSGKASPEEARALACLLGFFALADGFGINIVFGSFVTVLIFCAVFYTRRPLYIKKRLWVNTGWLALSRGLLPLPAAWSIFGGVADLTPWLMGSAMFLWVLAWQNSKDIGDVGGDKTFGITTPCVYHGVGRLGYIIVPISVLSFVLLEAFILLGLLPLAYSLLFILALPTAAMHVAWIRGSFKDIVVPIENSIIWVGYYGGLSGWFILAALASVIA